MHVDYGIPLSTVWSTCAVQIFGHLQEGQCLFADKGSILDLHIQYEVLSMQNIVEEDTWGLYV